MLESIFKDLCLNFYWFALMLDFSARAGWYLMPSGATYRVPITTTGMAVFACGVVNLIAYAVWEVKR